MKATKTIGTIGALLMLIGGFFKIQHWPGASVMMVVSVPLLLVFLVSWAISANKNVTNPKEKKANAVLFIVLLLSLVTGIFKIQHWTGGGEMLMAHFVLLLVVLIPVYLIYLLSEKDENKKNSRFAFLVFYIAITGMFLARGMSSSMMNKLAEMEVESTTPQELCAEQIYSRSTIIKPEDVDNERWTEMAKNIDGKALTKKIIEQILSGKVKAYEVYSDTVALSIEKLQTLLVIRKDTVMIENIKTGKMVTKIIETNPSDDINEIRFKEDWVYNPATAGITKKVTAYALTRSVFDNITGEFKGMEKLFWVKNH